MSNNKADVLPVILISFLQSLEKTGAGQLILDYPKFLTSHKVSPDEYLIDYLPTNPLKFEKVLREFYTSLHRLTEKPNKTVMKYLRNIQTQFVYGAAYYDRLYNFTISKVLEHLKIDYFAPIVVIPYFIFRYTLLETYEPIENTFVKRLYRIDLFLTPERYRYNSIGVSFTQISLAYNYNVLAMHDNLVRISKP